MGGFHPLDLLIILLFGLALFGPRALQSVARNMGKGVGQAKVMKEKLMEELPVEELSRVSESVPRLPLNTREAARLLLQSETNQKEPGPTKPAARGQTASAATSSLEESQS
jgi:Sec-independent protein translocase protein TatA